MDRWLERNPVTVGFIAAMAPALTQAVREIEAGDPLRAVAASVAVALLAVMGKKVRDSVTPTADPRSDDGERLVPEREVD